MHRPTMNIQDSILAPYVSDPKDDGSYVLNLSHEETMRLWEAVDAQSEELRLLRAMASAEINPEWKALESSGRPYWNVDSTGKIDPFPARPNPNRQQRGE